MPASNGPLITTLREFQYAITTRHVCPYIKQENLSKQSASISWDCIRHGTEPLSGGMQVVELVRILKFLNLPQSKRARRSISTNAKVNPAIRQSELECLTQFFQLLRKYASA